MILEKIVVGKQPRGIIFNVPYTEYSLIHDYVSLTAIYDIVGSVY